MDCWHCAALRTRTSFSLVRATYPATGAHNEHRHQCARKQINTYGQGRRGQFVLDKARQATRGTPPPSSTASVAKRCASHTKPYLRRSRTHANAATLIPLIRLSDDIKAPAVHKPHATRIRATSAEYRHVATCRTRGTAFPALSGVRAEHEAAPMRPRGVYP